MFPLPILPAQPVAPGAGHDATSISAGNAISEDFAALLFFLTPASDIAPAILDTPEIPQFRPTPEKGAHPEIADSDLEMIAAFFAGVPAPLQLPPESGVEVPIRDNFPAPPVNPSRLQPILSLAAGTTPDQPAGADKAPAISDNLSSAPDRERTMLPQLFDVKDKSSGRGAHASADTPTLSTEESKFPVFVSGVGKAEKIPPAIENQIAKSGATEKKALDVGQEPPAFLPHETAETDATPRGLAIADGQVDKHVDGTFLLPSERSGFFARDNNRGGDHESHSGGTPNQQPLMHGVTFQPVEAERAAPAQNHSWSSNIERLATEISAQARSERQEVSMRLEPPELGHVKIELALDGDRLQARITTEFAEAGALIQSHVQELRQALHAHNLDLVSVQVDLGGSSGFSGNLQQGAESGQKSSPEIRGILPMGDSEAGEPQRVASLDRGAVSVWA